MTRSELEDSLSRACREMRAGAERLQRRLNAGELPEESREITQRLIAGALKACDAYERREAEKSPPAEEPAS